MSTSEQHHQKRRPTTTRRDRFRHCRGRSQLSHSSSSLSSLSSWNVGASVIVLLLLLSSSNNSNNSNNSNTALLLPTAHAACDASMYENGSDCSDTVLGFLQTSPTVYGTLIVYALLLSIVGWVALLYPFVFIRKFRKKVVTYMGIGVKKPAVIVSMRRGRVFNPLRFCLPSRYNCYVTVEYSGAGRGRVGSYAAPSQQATDAEAAAEAASASVDANAVGAGNVVDAGIVNASGNDAAATGTVGSGSGPATPTPSVVSRMNSTVDSTTLRKELAIDEKALQALVDRNSHSIDVYTLPDYPQSGMLDDVYQGHKVAPASKVMYGLAAAVLLGLSFWLSFGTTSDVIFQSSNLWKFWLILLGHGISFGLAYWGCHFVYRKRVEALLYGTIDDGTAAYGRCGVASMDAKGDGGAGTVELADTNVSSASMNSLEDGAANEVAAKKAAESAASAGKGAAADGGRANNGGMEQPYHALT